MILSAIPPKTYNVNPYFSIIDVKLLFVKIGSTPAWRNQLLGFLLVVRSIKTNKHPLAEQALVRPLVKVEVNTYNLFLYQTIMDNHNQSPFVDVTLIQNYFKVHT